MRVFITGGAGFIGSHLCDALLARGDTPIVLDNLSTGSLNNLRDIQDKIEIHHGDIRDSGLVSKLTDQSDLVLHMAAALGVNTILEKTIDSISTNFLGSEIVLQAALKRNKRIIIASTSEIYGKNPSQPLKETDDRVVGTPQKIRWTYSDAKALEEAVAHSLFLNEGLQVTTIRFFNTVGPRQTGRYGMVLPRFVKSAIRNEPITIYGNGKQSRVFCHVFDAVSAVLKISQESKAIGEVFNVGGLEEVSINELAEKVIQLTNSTSKMIYVPYEFAYGEGFEDISRRVPSISKIESQIGWGPRLGLSEIITDIVNFERLD